MKRTLLRWHLGLGDALICNGLVRVLVERGHALMLPCFKHNEPSVRAMFSDLGDAVRIIPVDDDAYPPEDHEIRLGYYGEGFDPNRWDESFYRQAGVPFLAKWEKLKLPNECWERKNPFNRHAPPNISHFRYRFVHHDSHRGFIIPTRFTDMGAIYPSNTGSIFLHTNALNESAEIHCINSCFAILADLIRAQGRKFLHRYARPDGGVLPVFGEHWTVLDKPL